MSSILIRWLLGAAAVAGLCLTIYVMSLRLDAMRLERDNAMQAVGVYKRTLEAYQDQFAAQARALGTERGREIARQENLLRTLNLIGDIDEVENEPVPDTALYVIDGMYYAPAP